jgi:hypothetical protein
LEIARPRAIVARMWKEPLAARIDHAGPYAFDAIAFDGTGRDVARVRCAISIVAGCGAFGELELLDAGATPRQQLRALVLLIRESLRHGAGLGITVVAAETPPSLGTLVSRISGLEPVARGGRRRFVGALHAVRTRVLDETDTAGDLTRTPSAAEDSLARELG